PAVQSLLDSLVAAARIDGDAAYVVVAAELRWYMSDEIRTTAIVLDALVALRPQDPLLPKLVRGLMKGRHRAGGYSWGVTQDTLYALVALTNYAKSQSRGASAGDVSMGENVVLAAEFESTEGGDRGARLRIRHKSLPLDEKTILKPIVVTPKKGSVHYMVALRFQRDIEHQRASAAGLELRHEYLDPATDRPKTTMKAGDMVRVRVTIDSPEQRAYVAVSDALPAGFEPVQSSFATSATAVAKASPRENQWWMSYQEMHDDRVDAFANWFWEGQHTFSYLVRATHVGKFVVPAATAQEMYVPATNARIAPQWLEVKAQ
ncbi:MAG: hypothetical protein ABW133_11840, partial [Polyangiaceae bacterium]